MQYDPLNRVAQKNYSTSDPAVGYFYDQTSYNGLNILNGVGHRTGMSDAAGAEAWTYDPLGRPLRDRRTTNSVTLNTDHTYNLDGSLATDVYPSGRTVAYTPGGAGRAVEAKDVANAINYATAAHYAPTGALAALTNGGSIYSTYIFNSRLQPCWMYTTTGTALAWQGTLCTATASTANIMDRKYNFNLGVADNGNVITINNNRDTNRTQNFTYDALNRIQTAYTTGPNWGESFGSTTTPGGVPATPGIDAWGNLWQRSPITGKTYYEPLYAPALPNNELTGFGYDVAGNMTQDALHSYTYDAENRVYRVDGSVTYTYDGDGNRVKKSSGTLYWGAGPLAESNLTATATSWKEYVFFSGKRVARRNASNSSVHYYFADHLGSTGIVTSAAGAIQDESDYYPYGGEIIITDSDPNHFKFTGKERDSESGLDNFGARYHSSSLGRFMTPDWAARPTTVPYAVFGDPQSLNLYGYVRNDPVSRADPDGHDCTGGGGSISHWLAVCWGWATNENGSLVKQDPPQNQAQNNNTDKKKDIKPGDHVFVKVGSGLGLGVHAKVGPVKVEAEASVKSEGEYTPSGKAHNTLVKEAAVSGKAGVGIEVGYKSEDVRDYDMHQSMTTPSAPPEHIDHPFVEVLGPGGSRASSELFTIEVGGCLAVCFEIGIGVK